MQPAARRYLCCSLQADAVCNLGACSSQACWSQLEEYKKLKANALASRKQPRASASPPAASPPPGQPQQPQSSSPVAAQQTGAQPSSEPDAELASNRTTPSPGVSRRTTEAAESTSSPPQPAAAQSLPAAAAPPAARRRTTEAAEPTEQTQQAAQHSSLELAPSLSTPAPPEAHLFPPDENGNITQPVAFSRVSEENGGAHPSTLPVEQMPDPHLLQVRHTPGAELHWVTGVECASNCWLVTAVAHSNRTSVQGCTHLHALASQGTALWRCTGG